MPWMPRMFYSCLARLSHMAYMARTFGSLARTLALRRLKMEYIEHKCEYKFKKMCFLTD